MEPGPCIVCGDFASNGHHRKRRSQGGGFEHWNIVRVCGSGTTGCHGLIHFNPEAAYESGLLVHSWADAKEVTVHPELFRELLGLPGPIAEAVGVDDPNHAEVPEGEKCPTCNRRVPHKRKPTSPTTKVKGIRVPVDDVETFNEQLDAAAEYLGALDKPHHTYWVVQYALVALLQTPEFEGALKEKRGR